MEPFAYLLIIRVEREVDRTLYYGSDPNFHVIAPAKCKAEVGDTISYQPYGYNFGWFEKIARRAAQITGE